MTMPRCAGQLSLGEMQRIAIARVLLARPQLACLDEPFSALGTDQARQLLQVLKAAGVALLVTSQLDSNLACEFDKGIRLDGDGAWSSWEG